MSTPKTFQAHGHTWTSHTPGDPRPCDDTEYVMALMRSELEENTFLPLAIPGKSWTWGTQPDDRSYEIIGWRYADEQPKPASPWRPISEAPKDDTPVDIWSKSNCRLANYFRVELEDGDWFYDPVEDGVTTVRDATHFMPLPEPPTE